MQDLTCSVRSWSPSFLCFRYSGITRERQPLRAGPVFVITLRQPEAPDPGGRTESAEGLSPSLIPNRGQQVSPDSLSLYEQVGGRYLRNTFASSHILNNFNFVEENLFLTFMTEILEVTMFMTKVHIVKAMVSPVVMYRYGPLKKAEHQRVDAFELLHWRRL